MLSSWETLTLKVKACHGVILSLKYFIFNYDTKADITLDSDGMMHRLSECAYRVNGNMLHLFIKMVMMERQKRR